MRPPPRSLDFSTQKTFSLHPHVFRSLVLDDDRYRIEQEHRPVLEAMLAEKTIMVRIVGEDLLHIGEEKIPIMGPTKNIPPHHLHTQEELADLFAGRKILL